MSQIIWVNGEFFTPDEPAISALDRGLLLGYGVFETMVMENGHPFAITRHLRRLENSARQIGLTLPTEMISRGLEQATASWHREAGPHQRGRMRLSVTGGPGPLGMPTDAATPSVLIAIAPATPPREVGSNQGAHVTISPWTVNPNAPLAGAKTLSYAENAVLQRYARERGVDEILAATVSGQLCEGATSNVFVEVGGELLTPPLSSGCLPGITRELILLWGSQAGIPVRAADEGELPIEILDDVSHLAITGSVRGIMPITQLDERFVTPGPLTEQVAQLFAEKSSQEVDP